VELFVPYLKNRAIPCERISVPDSTEVYPNLIWVYSTLCQVVCSENPNPKWLAINAEKKYDHVSFYIGCAPNDNGTFTVNGYVPSDQLKRYPPNQPGRWENDTYRVETYTLLPLDTLIEHLRVSHTVLPNLPYSDLDGYAEFVTYCERSNYV
jgi:hypothetical protein